MRRVGLPADLLADEALLAGLASCEPDGSLAFVRRFQRKVFGVALAVVGDPEMAEDIAQQTFERAWRHAQMFDTRRGSVQAWLSTIAHNLAIDALRARAPVPVDPADLVALVGAETTTPERCSLASEAGAELRSALAGLPREQARALVMAGVYGLTAPQVARTEGIPVGTAKTRIRAGLRKLRADLAPAETEHV